MRSRSLKVCVVSRSVLALMTLLKFTRAAGYSVVGTTQKLDAWAEDWLIRVIRRDSEERFAKAGEAVARAAAQKATEP